MIKRNYPLRILTMLLILTAFICLFTACAAKDAETDPAPDEVSAVSGPEYTEFSDLSGKTVSMLTGAPFEELVLSKAPDVSEFTFFGSMPDMLLALKSGKTDAVLNNNAIASLAVNRDPEIALFPESLKDGVFGFAFAKGSPEREKWQAAYDTISAETKQTLWDKWTGSDEAAKVLPAQDWPGKNGTVQAAVCDTLEPMSYAGEGGELKGFDVEMLLLIARELDVHVEFTGMEFSAILAYVQSGKALVGAGSIIVTDERKQAVDFVEYYPASFELIVRTVQTEGTAQKTISSFSDLEHARIGVNTGSIQALQAQERFPDAEFYFFTNGVDMLEALRTGKIDAYADAEANVRYMMAQNPDMAMLDEWLAEGMKVGAIFGKTDRGQALCDEFSAFIREIKQNGVYDEIQGIWFGDDESKRVVPDLYHLTPTRGTLHMAADTTLVPFVYIKDENPVGIDVDTVVRFCKEAGYGLKIVPMDFAAIIPSVVSGKVDFAGGGIAYSEERAESVLYSEFTYEGGSVVVVPAGPVVPEDTGFLASIKESFAKTFIREDRYMLFLEGIGTTLLITVLSILFGTALGFGVFMLCRNGNPIANMITRFLVWLVEGMPVVVLLMILYYIIFAKVPISGTFVAVIGFTLVFGAQVYAMVKGGVATVDKGQTEAAYSLGYRDRRAFFRVVLPQALPHIMPSYRGAIKALIKATAIVGYVAVQDLTKMGDIVRSRTYEAFFPLIAVAVIYFLLAALLMFMVNKLELYTDPRKRKSLLKEGKSDDRTEASAKEI
ncbi:MAG: transporter substrate-binding domain-containing protein [Lachnospiraceae bacterium]|nr:transporter substrate-binding domain-containing protein [Lachnospiraceae bacterium]